MSNDACIRIFGIFKIIHRVSPKPKPPTRRTLTVCAPIQKPDGSELTVLDLTDIPADLPEVIRPDDNLVGWLDKMEKETVGKMCQDLDMLDSGYCWTVPPVRKTVITTLKKKYVKENSAVRFIYF